MRTALVFMTISSRFLKRVEVEIGGNNQKFPKNFLAQNPQVAIFRARFESRSGKI